MMGAPMKIATLWYHCGNCGAEVGDPISIRKGEPCPACNFSTFDWFAGEEFTPLLIAAVQAAFPKWRPRQGICRQCADIYAATGRFSDRQAATNLTAVDP